MDRFDHLIDALGRERRLAAADRETRAPDRAIDLAIDRVSRAAPLAREGRHRDACSAMAEITAVAVDSWSWVSPVTTELIGLAQTLDRLAERRYAAEWGGSADPSHQDRARRELQAPPTPPSRPLLRSARGIAALVGVATLVVAMLVVLQVSGALASAGALVALVLAPVVVIVPTLWFAALVTRRRSRLPEQLRGAARLVEAELRQAPPERRSGATDESLLRARAEVEQALRRVLTGVEADGLEEVRALVASGSAWSRRSRVGRAVRDLDRTSRRLARSVRVTDHLADVHARRGRPEDLRLVRWWDRWLIRFPVYSLFVAMGCYGLRQNDWATPAQAAVAFAIGVVLLAAWQALRQRQGARLRAQAATSDQGTTLHR